MKRVRGEQHDERRDPHSLDVLPSWCRDSGPWSMSHAKVGRSCASVAWRWAGGSSQNCLARLLDEPETRPALHSACYRARGASNSRKAGQSSTSNIWAMPARSSASATWDWTTCSKSTLPCLAAGGAVERAGVDPRRQHEGSDEDRRTILAPYRADRQDRRGAAIPDGSRTAPSGDFVFCFRAVCVRTTS
jgi:hypothetical protein